MIKYDHLPVEQRAEMLRANCYVAEVQDIKRTFSSEELDEMRREFTLKSIILDGHQEEKKELVKDLNTKINGLKTETKPLLTNIRKGYIREKTEVYLFDNQETGMMETYDVTGELIETRRLTPQEKKNLKLSFEKQA